MTPIPTVTNWEKHKDMYDTCECGKPKRKPAKKCMACSGWAYEWGVLADASREFGVSKRRIKDLGGVEKLRAMAPEFRAILLAPHCKPRRTA